ncbi:MAG: MBL fold metallo-hydrolase [Pseudomonadota bacterium]
MASPFTTDHTPAIGAAQPLAPGVRVITAPNSGPMTFTGTCSYLVGTTACALIDPGPDLPAHRDAILAALGPGQTISHILVTHAHLDHSPLATRLGAELGVKTYAFGVATDGRSAVMARLAQQGGVGGGEGLDEAFTPDVTLADGDVVEGEGWALRALHTPGHLASHLSFALGDLLFSGDHIMGWASTLVSPPDGDVGQFMASLDKVEAQGFARLLPGHGPVVEKPGPLIAHLRDHRRAREAQILAHLAKGPATPQGLTALIYTDVPKALHGAAARNVLAHLIDLVARGEVRVAGDAIGATSLYQLG